MRSMQSYIGLTMIAAVLASQPADAYFQNYLPGCFLGKMTPIKQRVLVKEIQPDMKVTVDGIEFNNTPDAFFISGKDAGGKVWVAQTDSIGLGGSIYAGDIDENGTQDVIVTAASGGCGIAPPTRLLVMLFDQRKIPHIYEDAGYYDLQPDCVRDFFKLPGVKGTVLFQSDLIYAGDRSYWRWHAYKLKDAVATQLKGDIAGCKLPAFVWYTNKPNHKISAKTDVFEGITRSQQHDAWSESTIQWK